MTPSWLLARLCLCTLFAWHVGSADPVSAGEAARGWSTVARATVSEIDSDTRRFGQVAPTPEKISLERKIGQMIVVGFVGTEADDPGVHAVREQLKLGLVGGVMLLGRNIKSPQQVQKLNRSIRKAGGAIIPLISVDQEGGAVQRLKPINGHKNYPSAWRVANDPVLGGSARAFTLYGQMASELGAAGFNVNFGPVVDLNLDPHNPVIGRLQRSYGTDTERVADYARWFGLAHKRFQILTAAKHFPGHGSSRTDSHVSFTDISKSWKKIELEPFKDLAKDEFVDMIMVGHLYHPRFSDGDRLPASLSKKAVDYVKTRLKFPGVIVSDDMEMGALRRGYSFKERIVRAVAAGCDILVFSNLRHPTNDLGARIHAVILNAVKKGQIPQSRIEDAYDRIVRMKQRLMKQRTADRS